MSAMETSSCSRREVIRADRPITMSTFVTLPQAENALMRSDVDVPNGIRDTNTLRDTTASLISGSTQGLLSDVGVGVGWSNDSEGRRVPNGGWGHGTGGDNNAQRPFS